MCVYVRVCVGEFGCLCVVELVGCVCVCVCAGVRVEVEGWGVLESICCGGMLPFCPMKVINEFQNN